METAQKTIEKRLQMDAKDLLSDAVGFGKIAMFKLMQEKHGIKRKTIETALQRGSFSKELSYKMLDVTGVSALFWQNPLMFCPNGSTRRKSDNAR